MYIRSVIAACLLSVSLVGSIPIKEWDVEVYARGAELRVPSIMESDKKAHGKLLMGHGPVVHKSSPHKSNKASHHTPHHNKHQPRRHASQKHLPHKRGKHSAAHKPSKHRTRKHQAKPPAQKAPQSEPDIVLYNGHNSFEENARQANMARQTCKAASDCHCPAPVSKQPMHSTSCINGFCSCDNPAVNLLAGEFIDAVKAVGNAPITRGISQLMQGLADVTEVASTIAGAFLGPEAKAALKVALLAFPDTGPSHIDQATKGILTKVL